MRPLSSKAQKGAKNGMETEKKTLAEKVAGWETMTERTAMPAWEALPDFGLYMDQVVTLLEGYLHFLPADKDGHIVSASAINNYVRLKIMPAPVKRKYHRVHLAYLLMILPMKQVVGIADIPRILPHDADENAVRRAYEDFTVQFDRSAQLFTAQFQSLAKQQSERGENAVRRLALGSVLISSFAGTLAGQLIATLPSPASEEKDKGKNGK